MTTRFKRSAGGLGLVALAVLFVALTVLSNALFKGARLDLTENGLYTVSDGTRHILASIDEPVTLRYFFSQKATQGTAVRVYGDRVRELLEEFELAAGGKLRLEVIDPQPFSEEEDLAAGYGLQGIAAGGVGDVIYMGLAGTNSVDDVEVIPFFNPAQEPFLEYDVARLVYTLSQPDRTVIGLISGLPMTAAFDPMTGQPREPWVALTQVEQLFSVRELGDPVDRIDDDVDVLLVVHPRDLSDATLYAIDQFVMRGGRLIAFVDPQSDAQLPPNLQMQSQAMFESRASDLNRLFDAWGFTVDTTQIVADRGNALMVSTGLTPGPVRHLGFIGVTDEGLDLDDVVTADLSILHLSAAGHVAKKDDADVTIVPLARSSIDSQLMPAERFQFLTDPGSLMDGFVPDDSEYTLAARVQGAFPSAFPDGPPDGSAEEGDDALPEHIAATDGEVSLIVVADTDMLSDRLWVRAQPIFGQMIFQALANNGDFLINALDNLTGSQDLISVRSRGTYSRPFDRVEDLRREADARFRAEEQRLQEGLAETERRLAELQAARDDASMLVLSAEQEAELANFQARKLEIRKELRDVQRNLDRSIESLGMRLKLINIGLVPLLIGLGALGAAVWRHRRRAA